jgi:molybdenum cofactor cytidylyltransferase
VNLGGIILAGGESRRMGRPKALLAYRGSTFLEHLVELLLEFCDPVLCVTGAHDAEIRAAVTARLVYNPEWGHGQLTSLQAGLRALPPATERVLFTLVDHPAVERATIARLRTSSAPVSIPRHAGRRGHPVLFDAALIPEFLALPADRSARDVLERHAAKIEYMDVEDPSVLADIDDAEAYRRLDEAAAQ